MQTADMVKQHGETGKVFQRGWGKVRDHLTHKEVVVAWDGMPRGKFRLIVDGNEVILDKGELLFLLRSV